MPLTVTGGATAAVAAAARFSTVARSGLVSLCSLSRLLPFARAAPLPPLLLT